MKAVCKKLFSLMLVAILLVSAVPFQVSAEEAVETVATIAATEPAVVETTEAAVEPAAEIEIEVTTPAVNAEVVDKEIRYVEFQVEIDGTAYRIGNLAKTKIGSTVNTPSESAVMNVVKSVIGSSAGYKLIRWELENGSTFTSSTTINLSMAASDSYYDEKAEESYDIIAVNAIIEYVANEISLSANGGTVAKNKHKVEVGQAYGYYGILPTPTKSGYTFAGWFKEDGTQVFDDTIVTDLGKLTAKWNGAKYVVVFEGYDGGWTEVGFGSFTVDANSVLKTSFSNFPTDAQIRDMFKYPAADDGWTIDGWEYTNDNGASWNTFTEGSTKITGNTVIRPLYKKSITLDACDTGNTTRKLTVTLGKRFPTLPHPGTRDGYAFLGWYTAEDCGGDEISSKANLSNVAKHPVVAYETETLYAGWDAAKTVYLYIYTNGNTKEHTKLVRYYDVPESGFSLTDIKLSEIYSNYGKYSDSVDEKYGWYDNAQWKNYCLNKHVNDTTEYIVPSEIDDDVLEYHIMLIDNGTKTSTGSANGTGYNDNKTTVDKSNPSTGDDIFVAVTIMAVSACALLLFFMNKKRIAK